MVPDKSKGFICENCKKFVRFKAPGTKNRNHCPFCLCSRHLDIRIGDRKSKCLGLMIPVGKIIKEDGEEMIIHRCIKCGEVKKNRVAGDDSLSEVGRLETKTALE